MMKCKIILACALAAATFQATADDYNYLTVTTSSAEQSITLSTVRKITFDTTQALVTTDEGVVTFPLSELQKMAFTTDATAISQLPEQAGGLRFENGQLTVGKAGLLRVYNASGSLMRIASVTAKGGKVDLSQLPAGLYIVSQGKESIKVIKD